MTDGGGNQPFHYLYGLNVDAVMAQDSPSGMLWALADRLGSIDTITDKDGVVVDKRSFDSFGRVLSETNPSVSFRYGYTGRERDLESGLSYYYRARYYDPNVGRFISVDPLGFEAGDTNVYRYVSNNSTNWTDPSGMIAPLVWAGIALGGALIGLATDFAVQSARKADNPQYEYNPGEAAISAVTGAVLTPLAVAAAATGPVAATFVSAFGLTSSLITLGQAQMLDDKKNSNEKKVLQALGVFGLLTAGSSSLGGGKPPSLGGASALVSGLNTAAGAASNAVGGSLLGGAIGSKAGELFQHFFAMSNQDGEPSQDTGDSTGNLYGEDPGWSNPNKIVVNGESLPSRVVGKTSDGHNMLNGPTRGILSYILNDIKDRFRVGSTLAYKDKKGNYYNPKEGARMEKIQDNIIKELKAQGITDNEIISDVRNSLKHAEGLGAAHLRNNPICQDENTDEFISKERVCALLKEWLQTGKYAVDFDGNEKIAYMEKILNQSVDSLL